MFHAGSPTSLRAKFAGVHHLNSSQSVTSYSFQVPKHVDITTLRKSLSAQTTDEEVVSPRLMGILPESLDTSLLRPITVLGKGGQGRVYLAEHSESGERYAVKILEKKGLLH